MSGTVQAASSAPRKRIWPLAVATTAGFVLFLGITGYWVFRKDILPAVQRTTQITESSNNIRNLLQIIAERATRQAGWPDLRGKRLVLWPLAVRGVDPRTTDNLEVFFSPADTQRSMDRIPPAQWMSLTLDVLRSGKDLDAFTSYAGPAAPAGTSEEAYAGERPLIADLHFEDVAIVGFADGRVRVLDREELGLGSADPIVAGPASKSPLLRQLSTE